MLDRKNAEISAKSSGELDKYEYLTGEDLGYKTDALTQAKFEYFSLGKVFTAGLDKSDKTEGLLRTLKNVENKSGNQLTVLNNLFNRAIKGKNNGNNKGDDSDDDRDDNDDDDDDDDKRYREIEARKKEYKDENNLDPSVDEEINEIVRYSENIEGNITRKNESIYANKFNNNYEEVINDYINKKIKYEDIVDKLNKVNKGIKIYERNQKLYKNSLNIKDQINNSKKFGKGLEKIIVGIDSNKICIGRDFITELGSIDLSWIHDPELYEEISQDVFARYKKDKYSNELLSIQSFLDNINDEYIKNKKDALEEFKTVKNNVKNENLKDIVKDLEFAIFGHDDEELEYEESIAERTKMRRQSKESDKEDIPRTFAPPDPGSDDLDKLTEMYYTPYIRLVMTKRLKKKQNRQKKYMRKAMIVLGMTGGGLIKMGLIKKGLMMLGLIKMGLIKMGMIGWGLINKGLIKMGMMIGGLINMGLIKMEKKDKKFNKWGYTINGIDRKGFNRDRYNINGYNISGYGSQGYNINGYKSNGYDSQGYNRNGYNYYGFDRQGYKRKALKIT